MGGLFVNHLRAEDSTWWKAAIFGLAVAAGIYLTIANLLSARAATRAKQDGKPPQVE